jgi:hypothetical protein
MAHSPRAQVVSSIEDRLAIRSKVGGRPQCLSVKGSPFPEDSESDTIVCAYETIGYENTKLASVAVFGRSGNESWLKNAAPA